MRMSEVPLLSSFHNCWPPTDVKSFNTGSNYSSCWRDPEALPFFLLTECQK